MNEEQVTRTGRGVEGLMKAFAPLVKATARRYVGRGADEDDLLQEGWLALLMISRRYHGRDAERAAARNLPGMVRDAAARMRFDAVCGTASLDAPIDDDEGSSLGDAVRDTCADERRDELEAVMSLEMCLGEADRRVATLAAHGMTQREISEAMGVSQQAIGKRLCRIKRLITAA